MNISKSILVLCATCVTITHTADLASTEVAVVASTVNQETQHMPTVLGSPVSQSIVPLRPDSPKQDLDLRPFGKIPTREKSEEHIAIQQSSLAASTAPIKDSTTSVAQAFSVIQKFATGADGYVVSSNERRMLRNLLQTDLVTAGIKAKVVAYRLLMSQKPSKRKEAGKPEEFKKQTMARALEEIQRFVETLPLANPTDALSTTLYLTHNPEAPLDKNNLLVGQPTDFEKRRQYYTAKNNLEKRRRITELAKQEATKVDQLDKEFKEKDAALKSLESNLAQLVEAKKEEASQKKVQAQIDTLDKDMKDLEDKLNNARKQYVLVCAAQKLIQQESDCSIASFKDQLTKQEENVAALKQQKEQIEKRTVVTPEEKAEKNESLQKMTADLAAAEASLSVVKRDLDLLSGEYTWTKAIVFKLSQLAQYVWPFATAAKTTSSSAPTK